MKAETVFFKPGACNGCRLCEVSCSQLKTGLCNPDASAIRILDNPVTGVPIPSFTTACTCAHGREACAEVCQPKALKFAAKAEVAGLLKDSDWMSCPVLPESGQKGHGLSEVILDRRTVRKYLPDPVPREDIENILKLAGWAPSGYNNQPWHFVVITSDQVKQQLYQAVEQRVEEMGQWPEGAEYQENLKLKMRGWTVFTRAPVAIGVYARHYEVTTDKIMKKKGYSEQEIAGFRGMPFLQSAAAAIQNLLLAAHMYGYGTCWGTGCLVARDLLEDVLKMEDKGQLIAMIALGKPAVKPRRPKRKPIEEVTTFLD